MDASWTPAHPTRHHQRTRSPSKNARQTAQNTRHDGRRYAHTTTRRSDDGKAARMAHRTALAPSVPAPQPAPLPASADVVIIGGGVIGASIAFHLAEADAGRVLLLERDLPASGSSGKPLGGVRAQFSDPLNIRLGLRSLAAWRDFARRPGADIGLD